MKILRSILEMQKFSEEQRQKGKTISFIPTMGFLHEGHLSLIKIGQKKADLTIVSIFVNPTQFGPNEDFKTYPRDEKGDLEKLKKVGTDVVFLPIAEKIYAKESQTIVRLSKITKGLCGKSRPEHFDGVATIVLKLLNIVDPHFAIFGEKDYQQLAILRQMVIDLNLDVQMIGAPIVRDPQGLALSSRNAYLNEKERKEALVLSQAIFQVQRLYQEGEQKVSKLIEEAKKIIRTAPSAVIDYVEIVDSKTLEPIQRVDRPVRFLLAVKIGKTRLIDNGPL